ncbi:hypothetical protein D3C87_1122530 [compost metagenome]
MKFTKAFIAMILSLSSLSATAAYEIIKSPEEADLIRQALRMALATHTTATCKDLTGKVLHYEMNAVVNSINSTATIFRDLQNQPVLKLVRNDMNANTTGYIIVTTDYSGQDIMTIEFKNVSTEKTYKNIGTIAQPKFIDAESKVILREICSLDESKTSKFNTAR